MTQQDLAAHLLMSSDVERALLADQLLGHDERRALLTLYRAALAAREAA